MDTCTARKEIPDSVFVWAKGVDDGANIDIPDVVVSVLVTP